MGNASFFNDKLYLLVNYIFHLLMYFVIALGFYNIAYKYDWHCLSVLKNIFKLMKNHV